MNVRIAIFLLFAYAGAFAQGISEDRGFQKALDEELMKRENGTWLYEHSEVFRKSFLHQLEEKLHYGSAYHLDFSQFPPQSVQTFSGDVSNDEFGQEETSVAISRTDPNRILIVSNDEPEDVRSMPLFLSTDGGMSWNTSRMPLPPKPYIAFGDPSLAADQFGGFYYAYLLYNDTAHLSNIMVAHSVDGVTWNYGEPVIFNKKPDASVEDKENITVDLGRQSSTFGRVYVSWSHSESDLSKIGLQLAWSDDFGMTWSKPVRIDSGSGFFPQVKVDIHGNVFYTYSQYRNDGGIAEHYLLVSHDHGATFIRTKIADFYNYPYSKKQYTPVLKGTNGIRGFPYIAMDYDAQSDILHLVYGSYKKWNDTISTAMLYYTNTKDEGLHWSPPMAIGFQGDSTALRTDRFMPWVGIDSMTGNVHIVYYSSQDDSKNIQAEAYRMIINNKGKVTYSPLSDSLFDPLRVTDYSLTPFVGDYNGCALQGSTFAYAWTENRKGPSLQYSDGEIYAYVANASSGISELHQVSANNLSIISAYPDPVTSGSFSLSFALPQNGEVSFVLTAIDGSFSKKLFSAQLASGTYERKFDVGGMASGSYLIVLQTPHGTVQKKISIIK